MKEEEDGLLDLLFYINNLGIIFFFRSLGRYSSEEESDAEVKIKKDNRRVTMAAPVMQPPVNVRIRKSTRLVEPEPEVSTSENEAKSLRLLRVSSKNEVKVKQSLVK